MRQTIRTPLARLASIAVLALYLAGGTAVVWVHAWEHVPAAAQEPLSADEGEPGGNPSEAPSDDHAWCPLCSALTSLAVLGAAVEIPFVAEAPAPALACPTLALAATSPAPVRARAPPLA